MKDFFGFGGYTREPEGFLSWQHLLFVGLLLGTMVLLAVFLGKQKKDQSQTEKNRVLMWSAILIDALELFKITVLCLRSESVDPILYNLPLFLCSIQLIALPLAAFSSGRMQEAATDFVCIFGILGAVFGTVGAGQNYNAYPVLSLDNVMSGFTHSISGFASLYLLFSKMASLKKKNIPITFTIITVFCSLAYLANVLIPYNYMFLMAGDGTPYDILYNLVGGSRIFYPLLVVGLFLLYIALFYYIFYKISNRKKKEEVVVVCAQPALQIQKNDRK